MTGPVAVADRPPGQPLRALALLLVLAMGWFAARLPGVERRFRAAMAASTALTPAARRPRESAGPSPGLGRFTPAFAGAAARRERTGQPQAWAAPAPAIATVTLARTSANPPEPTTPVVPGPPIISTPPIALARPPRATPTPAALPGFDLATRAYAALATGDRREADRLFGSALADAGTPTPPHAAAWQAAQRRLNRRWSGDAYSLRRDTGGDPGAAASPVLGGGQSGGTLTFALDPLAPGPVAVIGRIYAAHAPGGGLDGATAQAAVGIRWQVIPSVAIAAERLIAMGAATSGDWNLRIAGGGQARRGAVAIDGYGEAGVRGNGDAYAGAQARAMAEIGRASRLVFSAGPGAWGSIQRAQTTVGRLDLGAGVNMATPVGVTVSADWRWRVAGNAAPGSGPAITVSAAF